MRYLAVTMLIALSLPARAETVEGLWGRGFQGVPWGASMAQAKKLHPDGITCPPMDDGTQVYNIVLAQDPLGMGIPKVLVAFIFTREDRLRGVLVRYPYGARDDVLYRVAELLGQNYESEGDQGSTSHVWNPQKELNAAVRVLDRPIQRAYFQIGADRLIVRAQPWVRL
jgi:hypothetical protein